MTVTANCQTHLTNVYYSFIRAKALIPSSSTGTGFPPFTITVSKKAMACSNVKPLECSFLGASLSLLVIDKDSIAINVILSSLLNFSSSFQYGNLLVRLVGIDIVFIFCQFNRSNSFLCRMQIYYFFMKVSMIFYGLTLTIASSSFFCF